MAIFAKVGPERKPIHMEQDPTIVDWIERPTTRWNFFKWSRSRRYKCGHRGPKSFTVRIYGRALLPNPKKADRSCPDCSLEELKRRAIRCCLCGSCIIPGEPVALYDAHIVVPKDYEFTIMDGSYAVAGACSGIVLLVAFILQAIGTARALILDERAFTAIKG